MHNLSDYFNQLKNNDKLSHSFLIGNTTFNEIKDELIDIINKDIFNNPNLSINNPDLYILEPENGNVSKEKIKLLINNISSTSQFNNNKVYIIDYTESLNDFAYNSLLKVLEEPKSNIYAFLITSNINSVKPTIVSRCQKIFISSNINHVDFDNEIKDIGNKLIDHIEKYGIDTIGTYSNIYNEITDRNKLCEVLKYILDVYFKKLNEVISDGSSNLIDTLSNKILVIDKSINNLNYYLSKNDSIDRFIIEMWRCNNENS